MTSVGKKSLAWDFIASWVLKLIAMTSPKELLAMTKQAVEDWEDHYEYPEAWYGTIQEAKQWVHLYTDPESDHANIPEPVSQDSEYFDK